MPDAFTVLWTHDTCKALRVAGRVGERPPVAFSGVHSSLPAWSGAEAGDEVYAVHVNRGTVFVVSRMRVLDREWGACCGSAPASWQDEAFPGHSEWSMLGAAWVRRRTRARGRDARTLRRAGPRRPPGTAHLAQSSRSDPRTEARGRRASGARGKPPGVLPSDPRVGWGTGARRKQHRLLNQLAQGAG